MTVASFLNLASRKFYDGLTFHRVVPRFVIQGGDHLGTGTGGPGYRFENEVDTSLSHVNVGALAMANAGPNTNGSQFYVTIDSLRPEHVKMLDGNYSIFGQVTKGFDVTTKIGQRDKIQSIDVLDSTDGIVLGAKERLKEWNKILDKKFGNKLTSGPGQSRKAGRLSPIISWVLPYWLPALTAFSFAHAGLEQK